VTVRARPLRLALAGVAICVALVVGCEEDLRVPYIPPTLANWPQPYHGVAGLRVHIFNTGYLRVPEALVLRGGSLTRKRDLAVPAVLIEHPQHGLVLFNTGLGPKPDDASSWPGGWLGLLDVQVLPRKDLKTQMHAAGFKPEAVRWIVLSNLRADRAGDIEAFPNARVVVTKAEKDFARDGGSGYLRSTFDEVTNWKFIDFASATALATFPVHIDLFGDGSCLLLDASGSTPGAMAMVVLLPRQPLLLADGFAAVEEQVRYAAKPAAASDLRKWWDHIWRLKRFKDLVPDLIVLPGHDLAAISAARAHDIVVHPFAPPEAEVSATPTAGVLERIMPRPM
jgi:N-acyl homoserine lactone hydrolase